MSFAESVAAGVERGISECQQQFKWDRWNCPREGVSVFKPKNYVSGKNHWIILSSLGVIITLDHLPLLGPQQVKGNSITLDLILQNI